ncbi:MAG TPA: tetratricopeptide repeat protein [Terriglobia bacterium]|nr:tetratricopeptide repeat protein [Terriglobia bacterium]
MRVIVGHAVDADRPSTTRPDHGPPDLACCSDTILLAILALCALLPYANTLLNGFVYDDNTQVLNNPYIQGFRHLKDIFSTTVWSYVGAQGVTNYYRPMMTFGYLVCYQLFGPLAYGFHLANVILHAGVVLILFKVTEAVFRNRTLAFVAATLFAIHPIHTESVAWIAAVTDLELTFFYLLAFWGFLRIARPRGGRNPWAELGMVAGFALSLLSKEQALTLPALATFYEHTCREDRLRTTWLQKVWRYGLLWLLAVAYLLFRVQYLGALAPVVQMTSLTPYQTALSAVTLVGQYLSKLLWPVQLCAFYVFQKSVNLFDPRVLAGGLVLAVCVGFSLWFWKRDRLALFAVVWFFVTLAPVLNPRWMAANVFTERYLYLPSVGFCWLVGWLGVRLWTLAGCGEPFWRWALLVVACAMAIVACLRIFVRNRDWRDDLVLYSRTLAISPGAYHIRNNLAGAYWRRGRAAEAEREWLEALRIAPTHAIILNNLGLVCTRQKRYEEAVAYFERAMRAKPQYTDAHLNLGVAYDEMGRKELAELQLRVAVALSPLNIFARNQLAKHYLAGGEAARAEEQYLRSIESKTNAEAYNGLGDIYLEWNETRRAEEAFRQAVSLDPYDSHARFALGKLYLAAGRNTDALREYQQGLLADPVNPDALAAIRMLKSLSSPQDKR